MCALVKLPIHYEPTLKNGVYIDDLYHIKYSDFQEMGVKCSCSKSKTIHKNKNSFTYQHCKSKKHLDYLQSLNDSANRDIENSQMSEELRKEIKQMKIQIVKEHEALQLQKHYTLQLQHQLKNILHEKEEALAHANQSDIYIQEITTKNHKLEEKNKELETKNKKYEKNVQEMMLVAGYEVE